MSEFFLSSNMDMEEEIGNENDELSARPYQVQLEEVAIKRNTIIHLPTGSGKTFIAAGLITKFRQALQKPWGKGGKRTFFLVNNIPLVSQQKKVVQHMCAVSGVGGYSSEDRVDYWNKQKWDEELSKNQVIVMTTQILSDMLTHQYIHIQDINLLIFDECHHAVDDHAMRLVMKHFEDCPVHLQPRVLGLTATLLNCNVKIDKIEDVLHDLETTFHATIATVNHFSEVQRYSTDPKEILIHYRSAERVSAGQEAVVKLTQLINFVLQVKLPQAQSKAHVKLQKCQQEITTDPKKVIKAVKNMIISMITHIQKMGIFGGSLAIVAYIIALERLKRRAMFKEEELFYSFVIAHANEARMILLNHMEKDTGYQQIINHSSDQILQLLDVLKEYNPDRISDSKTLMRVNYSRKQLCGIIFTKERFTSKILFNLLLAVKESNPKEFGFLKHDFVVGFNINPFNNTREQHFTKKMSQKVLLKFNNKDLNCLISTSVIEEGIDIPQCSLVVRYDVPVEYRSYVQGKGRARSNHSSFVIMVDEADKEKFSSNYTWFQAMEKHIQRLLIGKTDERDLPNKMEIQQELYDDEDIPSYVTPCGGRLHSVSAISLLNRYCSVLPRDQFTVITPMWIQENVIINQQEIPVITIIMPLPCPIKEAIKGQPIHNTKSAKRSAALNACIKLYNEGLLDPVTLLPIRYGAVDFEISDIKELFPNWSHEEEIDVNLAKPGTKKRIRKHKKMFPGYLKGPKNYNETFYLHIIKLETVFEKPKESRERALFDLLQRNEGFGFLTARPLPKLCSFPMYLTVGEVMTSIEMNYAVICLNDTLFHFIKKFHFFIFDQVLNIAKKFLMFDGEENCLYVVPLKHSSGYDIDWDVMQKYEKVKPLVMPTPEERTSLRVTHEDYRYSVVTPWYRGTLLPDRYIVSNVLEHLSPASSFDTTAFGTYEDYYRSKYNVEIMGNKHQPLLEVRNINSRMNCLLPRAATIKTLTDKQQKLITLSQGDDNPKGFSEVFVPEFCIKDDFPGVLWYKAMLLPSIIHRVTMLLVAYELRAEIALTTNYGQMHLGKGEEWLPLQTDELIAKNSLLAPVEEPTVINTVDRINQPLDTDQRKPLTVVSMRENVYKLQKQKINKEYPWDESMEPIDLDRNLLTVTVMDIECYDEFALAPLSNTRVFDDLTVAKNVPVKTSAILPAAPKYNKKISILKTTASGRGPELRDIVIALTTINSHDGFNLERVETLGDSFLKFAASLFLFHKFPTLSEGQLTNIKSRFIGNRNLYHAGEKVELGGRMKVEHFSPKNDFLVPGFFPPKKLREWMQDLQIRPTSLIGVQFSSAEALEGEMSPASLARVKHQFSQFDEGMEKEPVDFVQNSMQCYVQAQAVSDKSVADCVEALVGTYLLSGGMVAAIKVLEWMNVFPSKHDFSSYLNRSFPTTITEQKSTVDEVEFILNGFRSDVEKIINYKFKDPSFLLEALSHPSYIKNRITRSYERLEFLGDAILDFLVTSYIFENCNKLKPGELTDLRSALVNNVTFAAYVVKLGLHKFICTQLNPCLDKVIMTFVEHQEQRDHEIIEDVLYLIDEEDCQIAEYVEVPKVLSDIFESLAGAIFLDSNGDLETVWSVYYPIMYREIEQFSVNIPRQPVRVLYENIHACPDFGTPRLTNSEVPKVMIPVTVTRHGRRLTVYGFGNNKFQAKRAAAKLALQILNV